MGPWNDSCAGCRDERVGVVPTDATRRQVWRLEAAHRRADARPSRTGAARGLRRCVRYLYIEVSTVARTTADVGERVKQLVKRTTTHPPVPSRTKGSHEM